MTGVEHHVIMGDRDHGSDAIYHDRLRPILTLDGRLWTSPEDGEVLGPFPVRANIQYTTALPGDLESFVDIGRALNTQDCVYRIFDAQLFVTESRVVVIQTKAAGPGKVAVGHLRFPWITSIGFRPKQSFLNESTLELAFQEDMTTTDDGGVWFHTLELTFAKTFHPGALAQTIARRLASHHLRHGVPEAVASDFRELLNAELLPDAKRGELSKYFCPAFVPFPYGAAYIEDGFTDEIVWRGPRLSTAEAGPEVGEPVNTAKTAPPEDTFETPTLLSDLLNIATSKKHPRGHVFLLLADWWSDRSRMKSLRSTSNTPGEWLVDQDRIFVAWMLWHPAIVRASAGGLTGITALLLGANLISAIFAGLAVASLRASARNKAARSFFWAPVTIGIPGAVLSLVLGSVSLWAVVLALVSGFTAHSLMTVLLLTKTFPTKGAMAFLGMSRTFRLLTKRQLTDFFIGVDKAVGDDPYSAAIFLDRVSAPPRDCAEIIAVSRALVAARTGKPDEALFHLETALSQQSHRERIHGWINLQAAEVLVALGRPEEALALLEVAESKLLLKRDGVWVRRAGTLRIRLSMSLGVESDDLLQKRIAAYRWKAIRAADLSRLYETEVWRLRLLVGSGNLVEAGDTARALAMWMDGHRDLMREDEHAERQILLANILLDVTEKANGTKLLSAQYVQEVDPRSDLERATDLIMLAVQSMAGSTYVIPKCLAELSLARALYLAGETEAAQAYVLSSLRIMQGIRYQLPTSAWRGSWELIQSRAFSLAFDLAWLENSRDKQCHLLVELIEAAKAQAVPRVRDAAGTATADIFDALLGTLAATQEGSQRADLLDAPPSITVARSSWASDASADPFPLRAAIEFLTTSGVYWAGIESGDWFQWFIVESDGTYHYDRFPAKDIARPVDRLLKSLPHRASAEEPVQFNLRKAASALFEKSAVTAAEPESESDEYLLLQEAARVLIPEELRDKLLACTREKPLRVIVGLGGRLSGLPIAAFPLTNTSSPVRFVERALISYVPSFAAMAGAWCEAPMCTTSFYPLELAVVTPNETRDTPPEERLTYAARFPPYARKRRRGYVDNEVLQGLLQSVKGPATAYFAGHVHQGETFEPASSGLVLANGTRLTLRDLIRRDESGNAVFPMPSRVVLAGCSSLGVEATASDAKGVDRQFEWFGLAMGVLLAGAHDVLCTLFEIPDIEETSDFDHEVTQRLTVAADPAEALRLSQLQALDNQRKGVMVTPAVWQSYVHICR